MKKEIDSEYAVTVHDLLTKAGLGKEKYFLYEGAMDTSLTGELCGGPLFGGLEEGVNMPLLLCRERTPGALIATDKASKEGLAALEKQGKFPELMKFDFSRLLAPGRLEEMGPKHIQRRYFKNLGIDSSGEGYQKLIDSGIEDVRASLTEMFTDIPKAYRFTTVPLVKAFWGLGISADAHKLLRSRHLLYPKAISPTPFGRQCGLVVRLRLDDDGSIRRELRVVKSALRAFWEALSFTRTLHFEPGTGLLQDRLERLDSWQISTYRAQREILPKLLATLNKTINVDMDTIIEEMHDMGKGEIMDELAQAAKLTENMSFGKAMKKLAQNVYTNDAHASEPGGYGDAWHALCGTGTMVCIRDIPIPSIRRGPREAPLSERLEGLSYDLLPFQAMQINHYLLAAATACDSSFPLWICHRLGLRHMLWELGAGPATTIGNAVNLAFHQGPAPRVDARMLLYALIVRPIAEIFDAQHKKTTTIKNKRL